MGIRLNGLRLEISYPTPAHIAYRHFSNRYTERFNLPKSLDKIHSKTGLFRPVDKNNEVNQNEKRDYSI